MYSTPKVYWATWIFIVAYGALAVVFFSVFVQNNSPIYTWFASLGAPGSSLVSYRNTFLAISIRLTIFAHVLFIPFIMGMIYSRETQPASITYFALLLVLIIFTIISIATTSSAYASCNSSFGNLCNSPNYCCVNVGVPGCSNPLPCPGMLPSDLTPNIEFVGLYWVNFVLFLMQLGFVITVIMLYSGDQKQQEAAPSMEQQQQPPPVEDPPVAEATLIPPPPITMSTNATFHGLKKRVK